MIICVLLVRICEESTKLLLDHSSFSYTLHFIIFDHLCLCCFGQNLRPEIPDCCPSAMASIMRRCWDANPEVRPEMEEVVRLLESLDTSNGGGMLLEKKKKKHPGGGCFCFFVPRAA